LFFGYYFQAKKTKINKNKIADVAKSCLKESP
jgi:hypothetical protein